MIYTQKDIYDYLCGNPLQTPVFVGDADDMNGEDYIFLDYYNASPISSDDKGCYKTAIEIVVLTKDFDDRMTLTKYITDYLNCRVTFMKSDEFEYYMARCDTTILVYYG